MPLFSLKTICRPQRLASCAALLALLGATDATHAAAIMAADQQDGYAGAMLEKVYNLRPAERPGNQQAARYGNQPPAQFPLYDSQVRLFPYVCIVLHINIGY